MNLLKVEIDCTFNNGYPLATGATNNKNNWCAHFLIRSVETGSTVASDFASGRKKWLQLLDIYAITIVRTERPEQKITDRASYTANSACAKTRKDIRKLQGEFSDQYLVVGLVGLLAKSSLDPRWSGSMYSGLMMNEHQDLMQQISLTGPLIEL
jgi:hypothetical protein